MKTNKLVPALLLLTSQLLWAAPFTYQGQLSDGPNLANGIYDLEFELYDAASNGSKLGNTQTIADVPVSEGIFTVELDFGDPFDGNDYWLEVHVRDGASTGVYTALTPRQYLSFSPNAQFALNAGNAATATTADTATTAITADTATTAVSADSASDGPFWKLGGNTLAGGEFIGSGAGNTQPIEFHIDGQRVARFEHGTDANGPYHAPSIVLGAAQNQLLNNAVGATISGGGGNINSSTCGDGTQLCVNTVGADYGTIAGGGLNFVTGQYASVGGGQRNTASGAYSSIGGGVENTASMDYVFVGGGVLNMASGMIASVGGGQSNTASGHTAHVGGGLTNEASGARATVAGGESNNASGFYANVGGGRDNIASGTSASVSGGNNNSASALYASVGGGSANTASIDYARVGGGSSNTASGGFSYIGGGSSNAASSSAASVGGGTTNTASGFAARVGGGDTNTASGRAARVGGGESNTASGDYASVAGGYNNSAASTKSSVGGGDSNAASGDYASVSGGYSNTASASIASIAGGSSNVASGGGASVGGGVLNTASGFRARVGGGYQNEASASFAVVPGGENNKAGGQYSFAAGRRAIVRDAATVGGNDPNGDEGTFVWADSTNLDFVSTGPNQFLVRASGGIWLGTTSSPGITAGHFIETSTGAFLSSGGTWTNSSDKARKEHFEAVDVDAVLEKVASLPIQRWNYRDEQDAIKHIGPMAQDFHAAFGLGSDDKHIATVDADGVALAAIQALVQKLEQQREQNARLQQQLALQDEALKTVQQQQSALQSELARQQQLTARLEQLLQQQMAERGEQEAGTAARR